MSVSWKGKIESLREKLNIGETGVSSLVVVNVASKNLRGGVHEGA